MSVQISDFFKIKVSMVNFFTQMLDFFENQS